jgi:mutator protein MutT
MSESVVRVAIGVVIDGDRVLISRRGKTDHLAGYWEFPGGKCQADETAAECVQRELREEVGLEVQVVRPLPPIRWRYPQRTVELMPMLCRRVGGSARPIEVEEVKWVGAEDLSAHRFPEANDALTVQVRDLMRGRQPG